MTDNILDDLMVGHVCQQMSLQGRISEQPRIISGIERANGHFGNIRYVSYFYPDDDPQTPRRQIDAREWESWVAIGKAIPIDFLLLYEWRVEVFGEGTYHIVTAALRPQIALQQAVAEYKIRNYRARQRRDTIYLTSQPHVWLPNRAVYFSTKEVKR